MHIPSASGESTAALPTPSTPKPTVMPELPITLQNPARAHTPSPPPAPCCSLRIRRPSRCARDAMANKEPYTTLDPEMPSLLSVEEAEDDDNGIGAVWAAIDSETVLLKNFEGFEEALLAETSDVEALEPRMLAEAKRRPDWLLWEKAINEELATLKKARTWRLETPPSEANMIGSKWVFKAKKDAVGNIAHYKARLVAQGFSQIGGVNYNNTYAPVAKMASS